MLQALLTFPSLRKRQICGSSSNVTATGSDVSYEYMEKWIKDNTSNDDNPMIIGKEVEKSFTILFDTTNARANVPPTMVQNTAGTDQIRLEQEIEQEETNTTTIGERAVGCESGTRDRSRSDGGNLSMVWIYGTGTKVLLPCDLQQS